jgi:hypothetical protein
MTRTTSSKLLIVVTFLLAVTSPSAAQFSGPDAVEAGSLEAIATHTTDLRFTSPWVAYLPDSETVTSPTEYLGHIVGAAGELSHTEKIYGYLRQLAADSERVEVEVLGETEEGREILLVIFTDEAGIENLEALKAATAALADPRQTTALEAERIIATARPIFYINAALHGDETGSAEMAMELAYRLAVSEQPMIRHIRERLVVLINPVSNPDGRDKMADWFHLHLKGKTDYAALPRQSPPYWGRYVFVDANRDAHQQAQAITRAVFKMFFDYHPTVIHDLHEAIALLLTWNGTGPYNPNLDPIVTSEFLEMAFHEVTALSAQGMPGVWTWDFGENFGLHYLDSIALNHNSIGRGYETYGNATAETVERTIWEEETSREWFRPWPVAGTMRWSMRDNVNYQQTALLAILDYTAKHADDMLRNFYRKGYNSWQAGVAGNPYAFVIPAQQNDRRRVVQMIEVLRGQGIEVKRARANFSVEEGSYPAGSYVVPLDQPYRNYAVDLLLPQEFPEDARHQPYDDISWALPVHYGVETQRIDDRGIVNVDLEPIGGDLRVQGSLEGRGPVFLLRDLGQESLLAARVRLADFAVEIAEEAFTVGSTRYPAGSWILPAQPGLETALTRVAEELGLDFAGTRQIPDVRRHAADLPRLGVWVPWADTDSIGWLRYTLDQQEIAFTYLRDEEIRGGNLDDLVDVIVYGNVDLDLQGQIHGIQRVDGPLPFTRTAEYPHLGTPAASEDITGGIGWTGLANLKRFVEAGGVLITLGQGSALALEGGMVRHVRRALGTGILTPGVELKTRVLQPQHPLAYGYPETPSVFRFNYAVYDLPLRWTRMAYCTSCLDGPEDRRWVVLQWGTGTDDAGTEPDRDSILVSGGGKNLGALEGRPALLSVPVGEGNIVVFNFNPMHRDLNHSDYRFLWNAVLNWRHLQPAEE